MSVNVTKYAQSCLLLERAKTRILIDPGSVAVERHWEDFSDIQAVFYTHRHWDHFDEQGARQFARRGVQLFGNRDICQALSGHVIEAVDGTPIRVGEFEIRPADIPHFKMVDGSPGPLNTGFLVDNVLFHPGDAIESGGVQARIVALPIAGPSVSFRDAFALLETIGAETAIPIHYEVITADPHLFAQLCAIAEITILSSGQSAQLEFDPSFRC